ncbi:MFS general substrate transporter [Pleomassaria siparia CBS 279.74]|uniref:MFS general substrate transporter n=1 Tax=Pleomassaria siparia CBS 279.74 TaxID=1314801 RepID=A0A6G1KTU7_9PLEO|nr:MFS general substrate transporter [Pleomassaria siparia CBS 279.74]
MNERNKHDSFILSGSVFLITSDGKTVSLPIPSESPYDPLNWTWQKRAIALISIGIFSYSGLVVTQGASVLSGGLATVFPPESSHPFTIEVLITAPTLFMGLGGFLWVPLTFALGRRPVFLIASLLLLVACFGASISTTFYELLICVSLLGFATGFTFGALILIIIDLTFIHERPSAIAMVMAIVAFTGTPSIGLVPIVSDQGKDWNRFYKLWCIPIGISFLVAILFFPETYFKRPIVAYDGRTFIQTASEKLRIYDNEDVPATSRKLYNKELPDMPSRPWIRSFIDLFSVSRATRTSWKSMLLCYPQIFFCLINPLIFCVVIAAAVNFAGMMFIGATYAKILSSPPYSYPAYIIVNVNTCAGVGSLFSWPLGGWLVGYVLKRLAKRNKGVREAEHYLVGYILPVITGSLSTIIYGLAVHNKWHFGFYYLAYGINSFSYTTINLTNILWITEAFPRWAAPALVIVGGGSMVASFAVSFALVPWIEAQGYLWVGLEVTGIQIATGLLFVPAVFWGKGLRQRIHGPWTERREGALRPL